MFLQRNTDAGPVITPIIEGTKLQPGDKIKVRIELRVDRDMEYVHMKDRKQMHMSIENEIKEYCHKRKQRNMCIKNTTEYGHRKKKHK